MERTIFNLIKEEKVLNCIRKKQKCKIGIINGANSEAIER